MERSFVMVKPDGVQRGLAGEVVRRLERRGLKLVGVRLMTVSRELAERHYAEHKGKPFYPGLIQFITSSPVLAMVWEGEKAISIIRTTMGTTDPAQAAPGSIRGDLAVDKGQNLVHGSDSPESAEREIALWFKPEELVDYRRDADNWVYPAR
ncbi:MAG: nucleoside-diphosphate kinase [Firmicutes bacterium]|nr:nucleoside-diphosphate kinase [Bacillota bacterium]